MTNADRLVPTAAALCRAALAELDGVVARLDEAAVHDAVERIAAARRIALYGVGREGLQVQGLAMRLYHLGLAASVVGAMNTPPLGAGDLLVVSAGPGGFSTVLALQRTARASGATVLAVTAQPGGATARAADAVLVVPAQTMADDPADERPSILPMGSLYEAALLVVFEVLVLRLSDRLGVSSDAMRARHTNLE